MFGKVCAALGGALWFGTMVALGVWWAAEKWGSEHPQEWYADWRFIVVMTMGAMGWMFCHLMEAILKDEKSTGQQEEQTP